MFCSNCGKQIPDGSKFCPNCGAKTTAVEPQNSNFVKNESNKNNSGGIAAHQEFINHEGTTIAKLNPSQKVIKICIGILIFVIVVPFLFGGLKFTPSNIAGIGCIAFFGMGAVILATGARKTGKYGYPTKKLWLYTIGCLIFVLIGIGITGNPTNTSSSTPAAPAKQEQKQAESTKSVAGFQRNDKCIITKQTAVIKNMEDIQTVIDMVKDKDEDGLQALKQQGKLYIVNDNTRVTMIDPGLIKGFGYVYIEGGSSVGKDGYVMLDLVKKQ